MTAPSPPPGEVRIAVAASKFVPGVKRVEDDWRKPNPRRVRARYEVLELREALGRTYPADAHLVTYLVRGPDGLPLDWQPRVNKPGLGHVSRFGFTVDVQVLFCDADNPGHAAWTPEGLRAARDAWERWAELPALATLGVYFTKNGYRLIQPLAAPVPPDTAERLIKVWLAALAREGLPVDTRCKDWTRHFRLPHVKRDGVLRRSPFVDLSRMRPVHLEAPDPPALSAAGAPAPCAPGAPTLWAPDAFRAAAGAAEAPSPGTRGRAGLRPRIVPRAPIDPRGEAWGPLVARVASAVRDESGSWHDLFLALAGALVERGVAPSEVPRLCVDISVATGADTKTDDRRKAAVSTLERARAGEPMVGFGTLRWRWRAVANALDEALDEALAPGRPPDADPPPPGSALPAPDLHLPAPDLGALAPANDVTPPRPDLGPAAPDGPPAPEAPLTLEQATAAIEEAIRSAGPGLTVIHAACGIGKTRAAERVALERANRPYASPRALGERAPLGSRTVFAFDKNSLSIESYARLRELRASVQRRFGPVSKTDAGGRHLCLLADVARPLVEGGQSLQHELCEGRRIARCEHYDGCKARLRYEGERDARIVLGTHALLGELDGAAGATGLLVLDEPPGLLETVAFDACALERALDLLAAHFEPRFGAILRPLLVALIAYLGQAPQGEPPPMWAEEALLALAPHVPADRLETACRAADVERTPLEAYRGPAESGAEPLARDGYVNPFEVGADAGRDAGALARRDGYVNPFADDADAAPAGPDARAAPPADGADPFVRTHRDAYDLSRALAVAIEPNRVSKAPPLLYTSLGQAKQRPPLADALGAASHVLGTLRRFFDGKTPGLVRVRWHQGKPRLLVTIPNGNLLDALTREGAVVVLDANADVHMPLYERVFGKPPRYVRLPAPPDGAPVARKHESRRATRAHWMPGRRLASERGVRAVAAALRTVVDWALESPARGALAIITFLPLELAIDASRRPGDADLLLAWERAGQARDDLATLTAALGPEIGRWPGELLLGHYGGVRGLDGMKHADALATIGDPWPNLDEVRTEVDFLRLGVTWEARAEAICRAELEQAHGRLRPVHRTKPARALHVGRMLPGGAAWDALGRAARPGGRPKTRAALDRASFQKLVDALGGVRPAARTLGCALSTLVRYLNGERAVPEEVVARCERALTT
ncbi:MAG TPA: hypothetical protein VFS43_27900 [Polyangiaceae bacterium]|nr:hypothetical protein [Polyangiaceae bacterium]